MSVSSMKEGYALRIRILAGQTLCSADGKG